MADIDTTNINDLPILKNNEPVSSDEIMNTVNLNKNNIMIDKDILQPKELNKKNVTFSEKNEYENSNNQNNKYENNNLFVLKLEYKIIILSTFFFFIFNDQKFKKYILNILVQIFGNFIKNDSNQATLLGTLFYSLFYCILLLIIVSLIDFTSFHFSF